MSGIELKQLKEKVTPIFEKYGVIRAGVFGSFARGETTKKSDIDFLIKFGPKTSLFDLGGMKIDLEEKLKKEVDLVSVRAVNKRLKPYIMADLINFYEKR